MIATKVELPTGLARLKFSDKELTSVLMAGGNEVSEYLKKFYREKDANEPNKLAPGRRTHFWNRRIGGNVQKPQPDGAGKVVVAIDKAGILEHKIKGGTIKAKNVKYLTIPLAPEAYGRKARRFPDLFVIKSKKGNLLLVKPDKSSGSVPRQKFNAKKEAKRKLPKTERPKRENKELGLKVPERETPTMQEESGFTPYYLLRKSVTQKPWPKSIPTEKQITDVFNDDVLYWVKTIGERKAA